MARRSRSTRRASPVSSCSRRRLKGGDADLAFYAFDLLVDRGEDITQPAQYRAQGAARGAAQDRQPADPLWRPCHRQGRGAVRRHLQGGRRGHHLEEGQGALQGRRGPRTGSRSNASSGRNSSSSAGRTATSATASARSIWRCAKAASSTMPARSAPASTPKMIHDLSRPDAAARGRRSRRSRSRARRGAARTGSSRSWSARSPSPNSPPTAFCATRASSRCARTSRPRRWCWRSRRSCPRPPRRSGEPPIAGQLRHQDQQRRSRHLSRRRPDQGRPRRLLCGDRGADAGRHRQAADQPGPLSAGPGQAMLLPEA